jgi:tight adherence protein C
MIPLAVALTFVAAVLITSALRARRFDPVEERLRAVQEGIRPTRSTVLDDPFVKRAVAPLMAAFANVVMRILPPSWISATAKRLVWAGNPMSIGGFVVIWAATAIAFCLVGLIFADSVGVSTVLRFVVGGVGFLMGGYLPQFWLRMRIGSRQYNARKQLPDALDLMTTSVEAGLSLDSALMRLSDYQTGPLQEEISKALTDMNLGKSRRDALDEAAERLHLPDFTTFVQALNQAELTGAPIGQVLRVQGVEIRVKRRQHAEAQAQRAPLLMIFPLVFFILPSVFIALLAPAALTLFELLRETDIAG